MYREKSSILKSYQDFALVLQNVEEDPFLAEKKWEVGTFCPYQTMKIIYPALLKSKYTEV
jgi:hypothetical protein